MMAYQTFKEGSLLYNYYSNTVVNTHVSFPYNCTFNPDLNIDNPKYSIDVNYIGNSLDSGWSNNLLAPVNNINIPYYFMSWDTSSTQTPIVYKKSANKVTLYYKLPY